jgi:hypothetical protein
MPPPNEMISPDEYLRTCPVRAVGITICGYVFCDALGRRCVVSATSLENREVLTGLFRGEVEWLFRRFPVYQSTQRISGRFDNLVVDFDVQAAAAFLIQMVLAAGPVAAGEPPPNEMITFLGLAFYPKYPEHGSFYNTDAVAIGHASRQQMHALLVALTAAAFYDKTGDLAPPRAEWFAGFESGAAPSTKLATWSRAVDWFGLSWKPGQTTAQAVNKAPAHYPLSARQMRALLYLGEFVEENGDGLIAFLRGLAAGSVYADDVEDIEDIQTAERATDAPPAQLIRGTADAVSPVVLQAEG